MALPDFEVTIGAFQSTASYTFKLWTQTTPARFLKIKSIPVERAVRKHMAHVRNLMKQNAELEAETLKTYALPLDEILEQVEDTLIQYLFNWQHKRGGKLRVWQLEKPFVNLFNLK